MGLHAINDAALRALLGTRFLNAPGAATLDNAAVTVDLALPTYGFGEAAADGNKVLYIIDGIQYALAAALSNVTPTLAYVENVAHSSSAPARGYVQAEDTTCYYLLCLDSTGTAVKIVKGKDNGLVPVAPSSLCPFAVVKVVTSGTASDAGFTAGVTNWNATGVTCTKEDQFCVVPASPTYA